MKGKHEIVYMESTFMFFRKTVQNTMKIQVSGCVISQPFHFQQFQLSLPVSMWCLSVLCYLLILTWAYIELKGAVQKQGIITITIIIIIIIII